MEKGSGLVSAGGWGSPGDGEGLCTWAKVVPGVPRLPMWASHRVSEGEIEDL